MMGTSSEVVRTLGFGDWQPPGDRDPSTGVWFTDRDVANGFPESGVDIFAAVDDESFWFEHRNNMIAMALDKHAGEGALLEVGSGSGVVAAHLATTGRPIACVEPILAGAFTSAARGIEASFCGDLASLQLPDNSVPHIGAFDVIEHLDSPGDLLQECYRVLEPGGTLTLTVPAHQWLWSQFDEWNGHHRRYSRPTLATEVSPAGFKVVRATYFFLPLLVPAFVVRVIVERLKRQVKAKEEIEDELTEGLAPESALLNRALRFVHRVELALASRFSLPTGTSILLIARKPENPR